MKSDQRETVNIGIYIDQETIGPCKLMIQEHNTELGTCEWSLLLPSSLSGSRHTFLINLL